MNMKRPANNQQIDLVSASPSHSMMMKDKASRKLAMVALSCALTIAVGCIAVVIGTSAVEAGSLPTFTVANALSAKQDTGIAGIATASVALMAFAALALVSGKR